MTDPSPIDPDVDTLLIEVPNPDSAQIVGTVMRPPRMMTLGRRRSDRWVATVVILAVLVFIASTVYVSWRQAQLVQRLDTTPLCLPRGG